MYMGIFPGYMSGNNAILGFTSYCVVLATRSCSTELVELELIILSCYCPDY